MPEFFSSFPSAEVKPANVNIGDMVNTLRGAQAYKSGEITLEQQTALNDEQRRIAEAIKQDPNLLMTDNKLDPEKFNKIIPQLAPRNQDKFLSTYNTLYKAQTDAAEAKRGLSQNYKTMIGSRYGVMGRMGVDDPNAYVAEGELMKKEYPDIPELHKYIDAANTTFKMSGPGAHVAQMAIRGSQTLLTPPQQEEVFGPKVGTMNLGTDIMQTTMQQRPGGLPPTVTIGPQLETAQVPPSQYYADTGRVDVNNQPIYRVISKSGQVLGEITVPGGVSQSQLPGGPAANAMPGQTGVQGGGVLPQNNVQARPAPVNAPMRMPPGETSTTLDAAQALRTSTRTAAAQVPMQQFNNNQIIRLADDTITGKGANFVGSLSGGYAAIPWTSDNASNLNQLGHYMSLQTASLAQSSGLAGTDAARNIAGQMSGTTEWTPQAIKNTARVNRALSTSTDLFNRGVDNEFNRTKNPFSTTEFQQRWTRTLGNDGINAIRLYDAMQNKDKEGIRDVVTEIGGLNSPGYQALKKKIQAMQQLVGGQ